MSRRGNATFSENVLLQLCETGVFVHAEKHPSFLTSLQKAKKISGTSLWGGSISVAVTVIGGVPSVTVGEVVISGDDALLCFLKDGAEGVSGDLRRVPDAVQWAVFCAMGTTGVRKAFSAATAGVYTSKKHEWAWIAGVVPVCQYMAYATVVSKEPSGKEGRELSSPVYSNRMITLKKVPVDEGCVVRATRRLRKNVSRVQQHLKSCGVAANSAEALLLFEGEISRDLLAVSTVDLYGARHVDVSCVAPQRMTLYSAQLTAACFAVLHRATTLTNLCAPCSGCGIRAGGSSMARAMCILRNILRGGCEIACVEAQQRTCVGCYAMCGIVYQVSKLLTGVKISPLELSAPLPAFALSFNPRSRFCDGLRFFENIDAALDAHRVGTSIVPRFHLGHNVVNGSHISVRRKKRAADAPKDQTVVRFFSRQKDLCVEKDGCSISLPVEAWHNVTRSCDPALRMWGERAVPIPAGCDVLSHWAFGWTRAVALLLSDDVEDVGIGMKWVQYNCYEFPGDAVVPSKERVGAVVTLRALLDKGFLAETACGDCDLRRFLWGFCSGGSILEADVAFVEAVKRSLACCASVGDACEQVRNGTDSMFSGVGYLDMARFALRPDVPEVVAQGLISLCVPVGCPCIPRRRRAARLHETLDEESDVVGSLNHLAWLQGRACKAFNLPSDNDDPLCKVLRMGEVATYFSEESFCGDLARSVEFQTRLSCGVPVDGRAPVLLLSGFICRLSGVCIEDLVPEWDELMEQRAFPEGGVNALPFCGAHSDLLLCILGFPVDAIDVDAIVCASKSIYKSSNFAHFLRESGEDIVARDHFGFLEVQKSVQTLWGAG